MKRIASVYGAAALSLVLALGVCAKDDSPNEDQSKSSPSSQKYGKERNQHAPGAVAKANKASHLIGMGVKNQSGEKIGDIKDLVVDFPSGKISYAVFGTDGKERLFAIPLSAFQVAPDDRSVTLQVDKQKLDVAQGFDRSSWPSVNNPTFLTEPFWTQSGRDQTSTTGKETSVRSESKSPTGKSESLRSSSSGAPNDINKASKLIGMNIKNTQDERLGEIKDLVVDFQGEKVAYVVLGSGGALGIGEKMHAIPLNAFSMGSDSKHLVLNASKDRLKQDAGFDKDNWPAASNPNFGTPFWESGSSSDLNSNPNLNQNPNRNENRGTERNKDRSAPPSPNANPQK